MKILVAGLVKNEQLLRLKKEGEARGHIVEGCFGSDLIINAEKDLFEPVLIDGRSLKDFDLIYFMVSKSRWEWYTAAFFLNQKYQTLIVNQKTIARDYNYYLTPAIDYLKQTRDNLNYPKSAVILNEKGAELAMRQFSYPVIVKTSAGRQGKGVYLCRNFEDIVRAIKKTHEQNVSSLIIRQFIPNDGDIRVFCVGYKAIGAMKRIPTKEGEFRSNISLGGRGEVYDYKNNPFVTYLAENAARVTRTEIAGVDIIIDKNDGTPYILEVNPSPQFAGLEEYAGVNAALEIIKYFESLNNQRQ